MSGPIDFLRAQLDRREAAAKAATPGPWRVANVTDYGSAAVDGAEALQDGGYDKTTKTRRQVMRPLTVIPQDVDYGPTVCMADAEHIAAHDPEWTLADVAAKRAILAEYERMASATYTGAETASADIIEPLIRALAEAEGWKADG
jgi:hypothetical protein